MKIFIVTAMIEPEKTREFWGCWLALADFPRDLGRVVVVNGAKTVDLKAAAPLAYAAGTGEMQGTYLYSSQILGPVPAFSWGVRTAIDLGADVICCFHDDMQFIDKGWDTRLRNWLEPRPECVLAGFGGGVSLGHPGMYEEPYDPMSLARHDFISNMLHAEAHGRRVVYPWQVSCLDGFSMIGRANFFSWAWGKIAELGITHHAYDSYMGVLAAAWNTVSGMRSTCWMLPERVHHAGGRSAVANEDYQRWAAGKIPAGDQGFWEESHRKVWEASRGILPLGWK